MKARLSTLAGLFAIAGASAAIIAAPAASADLPDCVVTGSNGGIAGGATTQCSTPGNSQIDSRPPSYGAFPWDTGYGYGFWTL